MVETITLRTEEGVGSSSPKTKEMQKLVRQEVTGTPYHSGTVPPVSREREEVLTTPCKLLV